jgi:hypothetical protein
VAQAVENMKGADEIWDYDPLNVSMLKTGFDIDVDLVVPMLYTSALEAKTPAKDEPDWDVVFYGTLNERRWKIIEQMQRSYYGRMKMAWLYGDADLEKYIMNAKVVLNAHGLEPYHRQEQVRMFYPVINGRTVVSETSQVNNMNGLIVEASAADLGRRIYDLCQDNTWRTFGIGAKQEFQRATAEWKARNAAKMGH